MENGVKLNKYRIGPSHSECLYDGNFSVYLTDSQGATVQIVEKDGTICNFPGIENCDALAAELIAEKIPPVIRYETTFKKQENGHFRMIWTVRPDGRFWMDSWGFGGEDYEWVELYADIDQTGRFTVPFRLYSIGYKKFVQD